MIEIERVVGLAFVEDGGRPGHAHEGVPRGGPLVRDALARANGAVGNDPGDAGIERFGAMVCIARSDTVLAEDDGVVREVRAGERIELAWDGRVRARYLAMRGGIDVPLVLGGRGTLVTARIGGLEGRSLRRGDVLRARSERRIGARARADAQPTSRSAIRIVLGPDLSTFAPTALDALAGRAWRLSVRSDRTGTRLEGPPIPWSASAPPSRTTPMIFGAIELPPSGEPIVLGPDHPTTGGYPVVALVAQIDLSRFHERPLGSEVRFEIVSLDDAITLLG